MEEQLNDVPNWNTPQEAPVKTEIFLDEKTRLRKIYESRAREGESCRIEECPHCGGGIAIYVREIPVETPTEPAVPESTPVD